VTAGHHTDPLGDYTVTARVLPISALAVVIGAAGAFAAAALLALIGLATNLCYYQTWDTKMVSPAGHHLGDWAVLVPVAGGLVIGLMARFGSDRIRGHGIPEAIEAILLRGSRVEPRVALLKPISAAISIGSGGPFGAEGPIIMTGGAIGSLVAQLFHLTAAERKTLLVAGAAAGMSATFGTPIAAALLAVELLLFEWKPRSMVPVAIASGIAATLRPWLLDGTGPLFPVPPHPVADVPMLLGAVAMGLGAGALSGLLTRAVYAFEDGFARLPIHWMWWPALGGLVIGIGGRIEPRALGVGYDVIRDLLAGGPVGAALLTLAAVKAFIWSASLGSGTSGGVLAPLLILGAALGGLLSPYLPAAGLGYWQLLGMAAILGGTMRVPFTAVLFALELTGDLHMLLPLFAASVAAYGFTVLTIPRSILTEKIARRGFHVSRELAIDPLEVLFARDVMRPVVAALPSGVTQAEAGALLDAVDPGERLVVVLGEDRRLAGVVPRGAAERWAHGGGELLTEVVKSAVVAQPDEPLRVVAQRMAETGRTVLPVLDPTGCVVGLVSLGELFRARTRHLEEEKRRERLLRWPLTWSRTAGS
jgi:CIC family chloride channel protein